MPRLGVNIDHVATLRQARGGLEPDPVWAAVIAELSGADGITVHLREDRRHIQERDLRLLRQTVRTSLNLEAALDPGILALALEIHPDQVTFVPERRAELTTEGGLDLRGNRACVAEAIRECRQSGITVSLFIAPDADTVRLSAELGADAVELHTGRYAVANSEQDRVLQLEALRHCGDVVVESGLHLHAGHGLNYSNVHKIARIPKMRELNIGHSIVARAVFVGLDRAVQEMKACIDKGLLISNT